MFIVAAGLLAVSAMNAVSEGPAVSDTNVKVSGFGGGVGGGGSKDGLAGFAGSLSMPIAHSLGIQIDGAYARVGDGNFGNTGAHLFWRDPTVGLLGVYAGYARLDRNGGVDFGRTGAEAQYYNGPFTLDTAAGFKFGDIDQAYGRARLQFYPIDDLMLRAGWIYEGASFANLGIEYQFSADKSMGMSVFVDGNVRDNDSYSVIGGMKLTFGNEMSLKDRHRRQDPDSYSGFDLQAAKDAAAKKPAPATAEACSFTPASNLCGFADAAPRVLPRIGALPQSMVTKARAADRAWQCRNAGYSAENPGPAACGCAIAFDVCS